MVHMSVYHERLSKKSSLQSVTECFGRQTIQFNWNIHTHTNTHTRLKKILTQAKHNGGEEKSARKLQRKREIRNYYCIALYLILETLTRSVACFVFLLFFSSFRLSTPRSSSLYSLSFLCDRTYDRVYSSQNKKYRK